MRFLAEYVMRGRMQAVVATAVTAFLSLLLPPFSYLNGAMVGLVTLRIGPRQGLEVVIGAALAVGVASTLLVHNPLPALGFALVLWLPLWGLAANLRRSVNLARSVQLAGLFGVMLVVSIYLATGNPAEWWSRVLQQLLQPGMEGAATQTIEEMTSAIAQIAQLMTGLMAGLMGLTLLVSLFIARWWQALLYNPGGFREEFHALRLGRGFTIAALLVGVALLLSSRVPMATDLLVVMVMLFLVQGLAVSHRLVAGAGAGRGWLVVLYVMLVVALPQTALTLAVAGFADNWFDFRTVFGAKPKQ